MSNWLDFYNNLTASGKASAAFDQANRTNPLAVNTYADLPAVGTRSIKPATVKKEEKSFFRKLAEGLLFGAKPDLHLNEEDQAAVDSFQNTMSLNPTDPASIGGRVIDVLSRPLYAAQNDQLYVDAKKGRLTPEATDQVLANNSNEFDAIWRGLTGEAKTTERDRLIAKGQEEDTRGVTGFLRTFGPDVMLDPLTYVGPGAFVKAKEAAKAASIGSKAAKAANIADEAKVVEGLVRTDLADKTMTSFMDQLKDSQPSLQFDQIFREAPSVTPHGTFNVSPAGVAAERLQIEAPKDIRVLSARAQLAVGDKLSTGIPQYEYGNIIRNAPENGFFTEDITRTLSDEYVTRVSDVTLEKDMLREKYAYLGTDDLPNDPRAKIIMSRTDEMVYPRYEQTVARHVAENGKTVEWKQWQPNPEDVADGLGMPMGEVRARLRNPKISSAERKNLMSMLANHIRAVEEYAKTPKPGYMGKFGKDAFYKDMYGVSPTELNKAGGDISRFALAMEQADLSFPKYTDIVKYKSLPPTEKLIWLYSRFGLQKSGERGLTEAHMTYLAQAHNPKSYQTRLNNLREMLRKEPTSGAADLADAIEIGRIRSTDNAQIQELFKHYDVNTLPELAKAIRKQEAALAEAEAKAGIGKVTGEAATAKQVPSMATKELNPSGREYKPYAHTINEMVDKARAKAQQTVVPAKEIVERAVSGDKSDLASHVVHFQDNQASIFDSSLKWMVNEEIVKPNDKAIYGFLTNRGVKRTAAQMHKGRGRIADAWNAFSQYTHWRGTLMSSKTMDRDFAAWAAKNLEKQDRHAGRADYFYRQIMPVMEATDNLLKQGGIFPVAGKEASSTPFSLYDAFASMNPAFVKKYFFSINKAGKSSEYSVESFIAPTQLMEALEVGVTAIRTTKDTSQEIAALMKLILKEQKITHSGKKVPNLFAKASEETQDKALQELIIALPELTKRTERNMAMRKLWHENQQLGATQDVFDELARRVENPNASLAELFNLSNEVTSSMLPKIQRIRGVDANDMWHVRNNVNGGMNEFGMPPEVRAVAARAKDRVDATPAKNIDIDVKAMDEAEEMARRAFDDEGIPFSIDDLSERTWLHRFLGEIFPHLDNRVLRPMYNMHRTGYQTSIRQYANMLNGVKRKYSQEQIDAAFLQLQAGQWSKNPEILKVQEDLNKAVGIIFSDKAEYSLFSRFNIGRDDIAEHWKSSGVADSFIPESPDEIHNIWRQWTTNDPLDMLSRYMTATLKTASQKMVGTDFIRKFGSKTAKPGYVKVTGSRKSPLLKFIDTDTYYYPKDIAEQMRVLNKFMVDEQIKAYNDLSTGSLLKFYDSFTHRIKSGLTIYRMGHHVRNTVGDEWLTMMSGDWTPTAHIKALKVQTLMRGRYDDWDAYKALLYGEDMPISKVPKAQDTVVTLRINGTPTDISIGQLHQAMFERGVLPDYRTIEDLQMGAEQTGKLKPLGGHAHKFFSSVSSGREHFVRVSHFIGYLEKHPNAKNLNDLFDNAAKQTAKWHPDGSDLSIMEQRFARRTVLFYSWIRKAIPLILEGIVTNPGKANLAPKAFYDAAVAAGIDPPSIGDPFPEDQLFPSWISDGLIGPIYRDSQDQYWGINPGIPMIDVLGDYGNEGMGRTLLGSINPLMKWPVELINKPDGAVAQDIRTGIPYYDKSDYIDTQIPNANLLVNLTGRSPSSLFTQAKGGANKEPTPDAQRSLINFLLGISLTNMSKPSYIRQAQREQTQRTEDEKKKLIAKIIEGK